MYILYNTIIYILYTHRIFSIFLATHFYSTMLSLATDYSIPTCFAQGAANLIAGGLNMVTEDSNVPISLKVKVWNPAVFERKYKTVKRSLKSKKSDKVMANAFKAILFYSWEEVARFTQICNCDPNNCPSDKTT